MMSLHVQEDFFEPQHQGDLTVIGRFTSSRRRVYLFKDIIIIAKKNRGMLRILSKGRRFTYTTLYKVFIHMSYKHSCLWLCVVTDS